MTIREFQSIIVYYYHNTVLDKVIRSFTSDEHTSLYLCGTIQSIINMLIICLQVITYYYTLICLISTGHVLCFVKDYLNVIRADIVLSGVVVMQVRAEGTCMLCATF